MSEKTVAELRQDGFFITGDPGRIDKDGYVHIVGRNKDLTRIIHEESEKINNLIVHFGYSDWKLEFSQLAQKQQQVRNIVRLVNYPG